MGRRRPAFSSSVPRRAGACQKDRFPPLTNGTIGGCDLIRVAVTRDISQAVPVAGSFVGMTDDYLGLTVDVAVVSESPGQAAAGGGA